MNIPFKIPVIALLVLFSMTIRAQEVKIGKVLPAWKEGYLDIHAINTGQGECTFFILPDGTTMLVDAGEIPPTLCHKNQMKKQLLMKPMQNILHIS